VCSVLVWGCYSCSDGSFSFPFITTGQIATLRTRTADPLRVVVPAAGGAVRDSPAQNGQRSTMLGGAAFLLCLSFLRLQTIYGSLFEWNKFNV